MSVSNEKLFNLYIILKTTFNRIITPELQVKLEAFNVFVDQYIVVTDRLRTDVGVLDFKVHTLTSNVDRVKQDIQTLGPVLNSTVRDLQSTYDTSFESVTNQLETIDSVLTGMSTRLGALERAVSSLTERVTELEYNG